MPGLPGLRQQLGIGHDERRYRELLHKLHPDTAGVKGTGFLLQMVLAAYKIIKKERNLP